MDWSGAGSQGQQSQPQALPSFPRIWVGYLLGVATLITEIIAVSLHPELAKEPLLIPPLYLFLANFISLVYLMVCVYEFHVVLSWATAGTYPVKPLRAAWFHLIPIYGLYWVFKWPRELARFVNSRLPAPLMRPDRTGLAHRLRCVSCAGSRIRHDSLVLVRVAFIALPSLRADGAAGLTRRPTAFFVKFILRRAHASFETWGPVVLCGGGLFACRFGARAGANEAVGSRYFQAAHRN